ncbi:MAG: hemin receptor [Bryobacteraceae bacterium]|nr:hemin receptor [Bryobacteraceae bacterium]
MTNSERQLIRESFAGIAPITGPLSLLFYGRLFELDPSMRQMFRGDIALQGRKLMDMLATVVDNLDRLDTIQPALHAMGQRHVAYGVLPAHYDTVQNAMIWALGQALEDGLTLDARAAWRSVLSSLSEGMKAGAAQLTQNS